MLRRTNGYALQRRARSTRFLPMVVAWQIVLVILALLVVQRSAWALATAGAVLLVAILMSLPVNGRSIPATLKLRSAFRQRARRWVEHPEHASGLVPLAQWLPGLELTQIKDAHDGDIGVTADGGSWSGILEVTADHTLFTDRGAELDLDALGALTRQDDVAFAGVQVVTLTVPAPSGAMLPEGSPALEAYREIIPGTPPPALRRTWVALRLDPRLCLEAVGRRGDGQTGVFATLRFGLHRAQALLKRQGMLTAPLDPHGISDVLTLTSGASPALAEPRSREEWSAWFGDGLVHETRALGGFGASPSAAYQRVLDVVAKAPAMMAVTSFTVSPGRPPEGAVRLVTASLEQAIAADDFMVAKLDGVVKLAPLGGVQVPGLLATVPLGRRIDE
ncbi:type VII secretion protein EccE [Tessaracoccus sp. ZS01]|uniref:type VII secretion protein EccE n=1 Tax=Tessaracoccus sp. ZS01 TaxID=1906324 RepID=UPI00096BFA89|nr:type VII secretion protein EccE [Tessaracoccus sp. ZS01]OMG54283.1 type VII secretion protein EccE [Tessaracoccus sp. ZS01]